MRFNRVLSAGALLALAVTAQHAVASAESITPQTPASASDTVAPNPINEKSHASARKSHAARKSGSKTKPTLAARRKLLMERFETLNGVVGSGESPATREKEDYDNRAYPATSIGVAEQRAAANAAASLGKLPGGKMTNWQPVGPNGVPADAFVVSESTSGTTGTIYSGRVTAIAISPNCGGNDCKIFIGAAGGGIWEADNALASNLNWHPSGNGIASNAIGSIVFDPNDPKGSTLYVGTGEPNGSGDSEAGVGLYKSTDFGKSWTLVSGSAAVASNRAIGGIAIDPANANHIFIGTDVARHGSSSINGGRFTPPAAPTIGLYESTDGGATFTLAFSLPADAVNPATANGSDFFRGGASHVELYRAGGETQVYASFFDYGVFRRSQTQDGDTLFHQIFASQFNGDPGASSLFRTEFSLAPHGSSLRVYVGDGGIGNTPESGVTTGIEASFWRVDNANVPAATLFTGGTNSGWSQLSSGTNGTPGFGSFNYCTGQCTYDMPVLSPPGSPDIVYIGGAYQYGEIDNINGDIHRSNGRAITRSEDAGVNFTDMTLGTNGISLHPDQHAIATTPTDPNIVFIGDDGGVFRLDGSFSDVSSQCASRGISLADLVDCQHWLSKVPTTITSVNRGLTTLQFQSLSVNAQAPLTDIMGGTQDNGTQAMNSKGQGNGKGNTKWFVTIFGDGGNGGIDVGNPNVRMQTFFCAPGLAQNSVNFQGTSEFGWDWIGDPVSFSGENESFYPPVHRDPKVSGTWFWGASHVWRTQDNGGDQAFLDQHCGTVTGGDDVLTGKCGDYVPIGQDLNDKTTFGADKGALQYVVRISRAPSNTGTLWAGNRRGRVFVTTNADTKNPNSVSFDRIDTSSQPTRFVSGISVDPSNPNHAFVSYSGYDAYASATATATGHVFEVTYNPGKHNATWSSDLSNNLGDQPITDIAVDWNTGDVYVSTDFGVFVRLSGNTIWQPAAGSLPPVAVYGLTLDLNGRVLYAASHGRGAWRLDLP
jgi:hypothetical protein